MLLPNQLSAENFSAYPDQAKRRALAQLPLLRRLPLSFLPLLLRELIVFDYKFPAERRDLDRQFAYLSALSPAAFTRAMAPFAQLRLSPELERTDWAGAPAAFSEQLTAHLWATHQIDLFRAAAVAYVNQVSAAIPDPPLPTHRLGIVVLAEGSLPDNYPLFRKLSPHGALFTSVQHENGMQILLAAVTQRAEAHPAPYGHWCIDGGSAALTVHPPTAQSIAQVSYGALSPVRTALQNRMRKTYESGAFDPEAFRSMLARTHPEDLGLDTQRDPVLSRFQLSVLTEGSGTQVFATTFVQWTAREALRRAQPLTLFARFAPRQREKPMNELLAESQRAPELDPQGSLIDADLGAYYTWLNQQRLSGASDARFLVWYENQALLIGSSFKPGSRTDTAVRLGDLVSRIA